ncbi:MAG: hypothetical protein WB819_21895, partial [Terriglobia bacterium]
ILFQRHQERFAAATPAQGWEERWRLTQALHRLFRRSALDPAALFAWLDLELLALERLRAALTTRAAFAPEEPA